MASDPKPHIRDGLPGDAEAIAALVAEGFATYTSWAPAGWVPPDGTDPTRDALLADGPREGERCWVADAPYGGLAGVARLSRTSRAIPFVQNDDVILRELFVAPECWGTGTAEALMTHAVNAARAAAFNTLWLATPAASARARAFYARQGFTEHDARGDADVGLELVVLRRDLRGRALRRREDRRLGRGPYVTGLRCDEEHWATGFPFDLPALRNVEALVLDRSVTLLAGDNGTGKSTIVEALAQAMDFSGEGGELDRSGELPPVPRAILGGALQPVLTATKPRGGYFLRAESFFNVANFVDGGSRFAPDLSLYGDVPLHGQSHGQSFLALAANRFGGDGLYLLDEPEAALSVTGALALLAIVVRAAGEGAQFVIATHSPVLLACPGARIYELDEDGVHERAYDDLDAVRLMRAFLADPARFLRAALED